MCKQEKLRNEDNFYFYPYITNQGKSSIRIESRCKECSKTRRKVHYYKNIEREAATTKTHRENNKDKHLAVMRVYRSTANGKAKRTELQRMRQYKIKNSDLTDNQKRLIDNIYLQARALEEKTGIKYHVDHVIPLSKGGLHVPENLQVLSAKKNMEKNVKVCNLL